MSAAVRAKEGRNWDRKRSSIPSQPLSLKHAAIAGREKPTSRLAIVGMRNDEKLKPEIGRQLATAAGLLFDG